MCDGLFGALFINLRIEPFESTLGKGENTGDKHFLLFPQHFLPFQKETAPFQAYQTFRLTMLSIWTRQKFCRLVQIILSSGTIIAPNISMYPKLTILTHYQTTNFRLFQTERVCRRQFQI